MYCAHGAHAASWHKATASPMVWMLHSFSRESFCLSSSAPLRDGGVGVSPCASDDDATGWVWVWDARGHPLGLRTSQSPGG
jgi:hypothetical protein